MAYQQRTITGSSADDYARCSGTSERGSQFRNKNAHNSKSPDYQSGQTFRNAGYNAKQCKLEPAVVQLVKYRIDGISDNIRTPVQLQHMTVFNSFFTHDGSQGVPHARRFGEGCPRATV